MQQEIERMDLLLKLETTKDIALNRDLFFKTTGPDGQTKFLHGAVLLLLVDER